ncbi:MAG: hypothetical protein ACUVRA_04985 [Candidatus Bathyarchaeaceae archaeon]
MKEEPFFEPKLTTLETCHCLALIEGQKEIARRLKAVRKRTNVK